MTEVAMVERGEKANPLAELKWLSADTATWDSVSCETDSSASPSATAATVTVTGMDH